MKAIVNLRVEIIEGEDAGYVLEETNRLVDLQRGEPYPWDDLITPYRICVEFVTPDVLREAHTRSGADVGGEEE